MINIIRNLFLAVTVVSTILTPQQQSKKLIDDIVKSKYEGTVFVIDNAKQTNEYAQEVMSEAFNRKFFKRPEVISWKYKYKMLPGNKIQYTLIYYQDAKTRKAEFDKYDKMEQGIKKIADSLNSKDKKLTDLEKLKNIMDYIDKNVEGVELNDYRRYQNGLNKGKNSGWMTAYVNKVGACGDITDFFNKLASLMGFDTAEITGVNHVWSAVKIDKEWKYFDATFYTADVIKDKENFFNVTEDTLKRNGGPCFQIKEFNAEKAFKDQQ